MAKLEDLIENQDWDEAKKRIVQLKGQNKKKLDHALNLAVRDPEIPLDLFTEIVKKYRKDCADYYDSGTRTLLWDRLSSDTWERTCGRGTTDLMKVMLEEIFDEGFVYSTKPRASILHATIEFLWKIYLTQDENQSLPINIHYGYYSYTGTGNREQAISVAKERVQNQLLSITSMHDLKEYPELNLLWEKTMMLLRYHRIVEKATHEQEGISEQGLVVHEVVFAQLPPIVVWLSNRLYPNMLGKRDSRGFLPLHYAISKQNYDRRFCFSGELSIANDSIFKLLVTTFPEAAQFLDFDGNLPLTFLLKRRCCKLDDVEALVKAEPRALITRNINTAYYPFMTAASRTNTYRTTPEEELSLVYLLLRLNPLAISAGIKENDHELYLKKKLAASESKVTSLQNNVETLLAENKQKDEEIEKLRAELHSVKNETVLKRSASAAPLPDGKKARVLPQT